MTRVVAAAAVKRSTGVYSLPPPARHHHIIHKLYDEGFPQGPDEVQGFLLSDGTFVDRVQAGQIALACQQIPRLRWPPNLYSEDLW
jgi:hypothetical protein